MSRKIGYNVCRPTVLLCVPVLYLEGGHQFLIWVSYTPSVVLRCSVLMMHAYCNRVFCFVP